MEYITFIEGLQVPATVNGLEAKSLYACLVGVRDGRAKQGRRYRAAVVISIMLLAKLAGEKRVKGIAKWARLRQAWLAEHLPLRPGKAPCLNPYRYVCAHLNLQELQGVLGAYFAEVREPPTRGEAGAPPAAALPEVRPHPLALDGKSLRGTRRTGHDPKATSHVVGLYNVTADSMWRQQTVMGKGKERQAALALIAPLDLQGYVVSADALHTQPKWGQAILNRGGDYLLIAKRNQSALRAAIAVLFSQAPQPHLFPEQQAHSVDKAPGAPWARLEVRHLRVSCELNDYLAPRWPQVAQVFQGERIVARHGKTTHELAYGLTTLSPQIAPPTVLLALIRAHWHIENRNHWRRDVTLGEDACLVTTGQIPQVLAALNNTVLALVDRLKQPNLADALRDFAAYPATALTLLLHPLALHSQIPTFV